MKFRHTLFGFALLTSFSAPSFAASLDETLESAIVTHNETSDFTLSWNPKVRDYLVRYLNEGPLHRELTGALQRFSSMEDYLRDRLDDHGMPQEVLSIPVVETSYRNIASRGRNSMGGGLWMLTKGTARKLGLRVSKKTDERLVLAKQTQAALRLIRIYYDQFQNWELAILAYNAGEGTVRKGILKTGSRDPWVISDAGFHADPDYLAKIEAVSLIMTMPELQKMVLNNKEWSEAKPLTEVNHLDPERLGNDTTQESEARPEPVAHPSWDLHRIKP